MKDVRKHMILLTGVMFALLLFACQNADPVSPQMNEIIPGQSFFGKGDERPMNFPIAASKTFYYDSLLGYYPGGQIKFPNGHRSKFKVKDHALIPPPEYTFGDSVTITMEVDYDSLNQELIFDFGPSGCQFEPSARIKLDYKLLGTDRPLLYYIDESGNYILQKPERINRKKKWLWIEINHFSRYALAHG